MILFVSGEYPPEIGGLADYTHRLRCAVSELGWPSSVLSRRQVRRWDVRSLVRLLRAARRERLVHIQYQAAAYDLLGDICLVPGLLRRLSPAARVVTTFHDARVPYLFPRAGWFRAAALRLMARGSHAVIAADQRDLELLGGPSQRYHQVPIGPNVACSLPAGYDRAQFRSRLGLDADTLAIVYFGLSNASKGLTLLLDCFELLADLSGDARLLLVGGAAGASDPTDRQTAASVESRIVALGSRVIRTGWLAPAEVSAYLVAGDVALLPYTDGASPRRGSLLACAEHGLPIVSTLPAAPEVAPAVHAVSADATTLAKAVLHVANSQQLTGRLRAASRVLASQMSWPAIAATHVQIYERLLYSQP